MLTSDQLSAMIDFKVVKEIGGASTNEGDCRR
jgi:hypothetical protein